VCCANAQLILEKLAAMAEANAPAASTPEVEEEEEKLPTVGWQPPVLPPPHPDAMMPEKGTWDEESIRAVIATPNATGINGMVVIQEYRPDTLAGHTACWKAAKLGMWDEVAQLIDLGADPNAVDEYEFTMIMWACKNGHLETVRKLLDTGKIDLDAMTQYGFTALMWAKKHEHEDIVKLLKQSGAKEKTPMPWEEDCPKYYSWKARGGSKRPHPPPTIPIPLSELLSS
jgi:hypothetical protein